MNAATNQLPIQVNGLTQPEAEFVYNIEVLGLPARKAAYMDPVAALAYE